MTGLPKRSAAGHANNRRPAKDFRQELTIGIRSQTGQLPPPWVVGQFDYGRIAGLNRVTMGAYSTDVGAATNLHGAEKSRNWLGDRYSMARWRNGSHQGLYYGT